MDWSAMIRFDPSENVIDAIKSNKMLNDEGNEELAYTILNSALEYGRTDIADIFLSNPNCTITPVKKYLTPHNTPLHNAVMLGDLRIVDILLKKKAPIYVCNAENNTPLHLAFFKQNYAIMEELLAAMESSSNCQNIKNNFGLSLLHIACSADKINIVNKLLKSNADLKEAVSDDSTMWKGFTAIHFAAEYQALELLKIIVDKSSKADLSRKNGYGQTALQIIVKKSENLLVMFDLLSLDTKTNSYQSISNFHVACARDDRETIEQFLDKGAPINATVSKDANICCEYTPLHFAIQRKSLENVRILLERGADLYRVNDENMTPLHLALYTEEKGKRSPLVDLLYAATNNKEANATDWYNLSYLHIACTRNDVDLVEHLLNNNADVNSTVSDAEKKFYNFTPLHFAVCYENVDVARLLIERDADVNACTNGDGDGTPLHIALFQGHTALIELLLANGADPKIVRPLDEESALSLLVYGYITRKDDQLLPYIEKLIMDCDIDVNAKDHEGDTALHVACERLSSTRPVVKLLLELGADINAENDKGETPFMWTMQKENYSHFDKTADYMVLYHHVHRLKSFGLRVSEKNEKCCEKLMTKRGVWSTNVAKFTDESSAFFEQERQEEIARMKQLELIPNLSLYDFLMLEPGRAAVYKEFGLNLNATASLASGFTIYGYLVKLQLHKIALISQNLVAGVDVEYPAKRQRYSCL